MREARLEAARLVIETGREAGVEFVAVCGDTFEANGVDRVLVQKVVDILAGFDGLVYVTPGNHDPFMPGSVWEHPAWRSFAALFRIWGVTVKMNLAGDANGPVGSTILILDVVDQSLISGNQHRRRHLGARQVETVVHRMVDRHGELRGPSNEVIAEMEGDNLGESCELVKVRLWVRDFAAPNLFQIMFPNSVSRISGACRSSRSAGTCRASSLHRAAAHSEVRWSTLRRSSLLRKSSRR